MPRASCCTPTRPRSCPRTANTSPAGGAKGAVAGARRRAARVAHARARLLCPAAPPFLPEDGNYTSVGVVKVAGAEPQQLALQGLFLPTVAFRDGAIPISIFPGAKNPA